MPPLVKFRAAPRLYLGSLSKAAHLLEGARPHRAAAPCGRGCTQAGLVDDQQLENVVEIRNRALNCLTLGRFAGLE